MSHKVSKISIKQKFFILNNLLIKWFDVSRLCLENTYNPEKSSTWEQLWFGKAVISLLDSK